MNGEEREGTAEAVAWGPQADDEDGDVGALRLSTNRRRLARRRTETCENGEHRAQAVATVRSRLSRALAAKED